MARGTVVPICARESREKEEGEEERMGGGEER